MKGCAFILFGAGVAPSERITGLSLVERALALARSLELRPCLVGPAALWTDPAIRSLDVDRAVPGAAVVPFAGTALLFRADSLFVAALPRRMLENLPLASIVEASDARPAIVSCPAESLSQGVPASLEEALEAGCCGQGDDRRAAATRGADLASGFAVLALPRGPERRPACGGDPGSRAGGAFREAEATLLRSLENPRDGVFDRRLNRHISRRITLALLPSAVTPDLVTVVSVLVGALGALALSAPGWAFPVLGALLLQLSAVLDCVDGEIARAKVQESARGEWLDISADTLTHILTFVGIAGHVLPEIGAGLAWMLAGSFALGGLASFVVVTWAERTEPQWRTAGNRRARLLAGLLQALTTRDLSVLVLAAAVSGLLPELLEGAAVGAHVFWIVVLVLLLGLREQGPAASSGSRPDDRPHRAAA